MSGGKISIDLSVLNEKKDELTRLKDEMLTYKSSIIISGSGEALDGLLDAYKKMESIKDTLVLLVDATELALSATEEGFINADTY
ncbi:hypothetical protein HCA99_10460 [Listeria booriae]|uniref:hypothetical protein n=1 Tax=Listeria booriae TaxID=1552123 RepID=UPI001626732A|nr:hypothetical protein [Listeria booriae]MBC2079633.1 hypothetical protein [Listeria booriae]